jgi:tetratricopeptide (TPR) repeat protein
MEAEEWQKSIQYLKICASYFGSDNCSNKKYIIATQINIGTAYQKLNILDSALKYNDLAIANAQKYKIKDYLSAVYLNIGEINILLEKYDESINNFEQSMKYRALYSEHQDYYRGLYGLGIAESRKKNYKIALNHLNAAIGFFIQNKDFINIREASREICRIYEQKNDFKNYLKYSKLYNQAKDSIYARKSNSNMSAMKLKYEMDKIQTKSKSEIELLTKKSQLNQLRWLMAISTLILVCGISIALYFRHLTNKKLMKVELLNFQLEQKQLENEIHYKKRDIENLTLHIVQKNEFLEQIKNDVKTLKQDIKPEKQTKLKSISLKISQSTRKNKELEKLQENIDKINWNFLNNLTEKFPELTEKEKRLCTLLKLNFKSKEIAGLNNVSEEAVIKARHRMRKKMGLSPDENLTEFIHRI